MLIKGTSRATFGSLPGAQTARTNDQCGKCKPESLSWKPTFDISNAGPLNRFTVLTDEGPLIVHNCGYEGGVGAFATFAAVYCIDLEQLSDQAARAIPPAVWGQANIMLAWHRNRNTDPPPSMGMSDRAWLTCESIKLAWRTAHPNIVAMWRELDQVVRKAIAQPGNTFRCRMLKIRRDGSWLRIVLPSGRAICYPSPEIDEEGRITYMGIHQYSRKWVRLNTYSGKLYENICQAVARDVMAHNMQPIEDAGYNITLTVHDEIITEAPDTPEYNDAALSALLSAVPPWAQGMPLASAGFEAYRYRKE
jgi:DNA polymerase